MTASRKTKGDSSKRARTWLKPDQVEQLRDTALTTGATYLQDRNEILIAVLYEVGLRNAELVALDVDDFDLKNQELYLPSEKQKQYPSENHVPPPRYLDLSRELSRDLRRYFNNRWKESEAVFPSRQSDRMTTQSVRNTVRRLSETAGIEPFLESGGRGESGEVTPHTLRHSVAYRMLRVEGKRLVDVRDRLRHSSIQTTEQIYEHF